jgi:multiple sugar transport system permease protein
MSRWGKESRALGRGLAFLSPWLIGFLGFTAFPIALSLYYSFCDYSLLQPPLFKGLANYRMLAQDPVFWKALRNTAAYTG